MRCTGSFISCKATVFLLYGCYFNIGELIYSPLATVSSYARPSGVSKCNPVHTRRNYGSCTISIFPTTPCRASVEAQFMYIELEPQHGNKRNIN